MLTQNQKQTLLKIARETIEQFLADGLVKEFLIDNKRLEKEEGAFVTLYKNGQLRGCIGRILAEGQPLWQTVRDMAIAAATEDPRFPSVTSDELDKIDIEISVLSEPIEIDDWQKVELGRHGVIVSKGFRSGVYLPQVAEETGWSKEEFLASLCAEKAGLASDAYKNDFDVKIEVFEADVFGEK